jgi:hypothetical protein
MVRFTIFSGHEGSLGPDGDIYITVFAGSDLERPPLATLAARTRGQPNPDYPAARYTFFTLFGGVEVRWPTIAQEFLALRDALRSGALTLADWDGFVARHGQAGGLRVNAFTLFGGCNGDGVPSEDKELDDLALHRHLGHLTDAALQTLLPAIGQKGALRLAVLRQAAGSGG